MPAVQAEPVSLEGELQPLNRYHRLSSPRPMDLNRLLVWSEACACVTRENDSENDSEYGASEPLTSLADARWLSRRLA